MYQQGRAWNATPSRASRLPLDRRCSVLGHKICSRTDSVRRQTLCVLGQILSRTDFSTQDRFCPRADFFRPRTDSVLDRFFCPRTDSVLDRFFAPGPILSQSRNFSTQDRSCPRAEIFQPRIYPVPEQKFFDAGQDLSHSRTSSVSGQILSQSRNFSTQDRICPRAEFFLFQDRICPGAELVRSRTDSVPEQKYFAPGQILSWSSRLE